MKIQDAPLHTLLVMREKMGEEVRHTYYVRREGPAKLEGYVATYRIAVTQGYLWRGAAL